MMWSISVCSQNYPQLSRQKVTGCVFDTGWNVIVVIMVFVLCNTKRIMLATMVEC